jgi:uncharacterized protein (TIGR02391 family)
VSSPLNQPQFPSAQDAAELPLDELALRLLRYFAVDGSNASRSYVANQGTWEASAPDDEVRWTATLHAGEAWDWLMYHGLIAMRPGATNLGEVGYVTERGHQVARDERGLARTRAEARIGLDLHPRLAGIRTQFLLGEYELAVFAAMREVEIRVREVGAFGSEDFGTNLMRKAFQVDDGRLTDTARVPSERQAISDLFAGAIGLFKNPSSHRQVDFGDPVIASEIALFADLLLRMLDAAAKRIEDYKRLGEGRLPHDRFPPNGEQCEHLLTGLGFARSGRLNCWLVEGPESLRGLCFLRCRGLSVSRMRARGGAVGARRAGVSRSVSAGVCGCEQA